MAGHCGTLLLVDPGPGLYHLCVAEAQMIIEAVRPKVAVLTHFGTHVWRAKPWEIAARDGMRLELE